PPGSLHRYPSRRSSDLGGALDLGRHAGSTALFVHSPDTAGQVAIGDSVRVTGEVSEYYGATQVSVGADGLELLEEPLGTDADLGDRKSTRLNYSHASVS